MTIKTVKKCTSCCTTTLVQKTHNNIIYVYIDMQTVYSYNIMTYIVRLIYSV